MTIYEMFFNIFAIGDPDRHTETNKPENVQKQSAVRTTIVYRKASSDENLVLMLPKREFIITEERMESIVGLALLKKDWLQELVQERNLPKSVGRESNNPKTGSVNQNSKTSTRSKSETTKSARATMRNSNTDCSLNNRKVFVRLVLQFRYGRDDEELMGLKFSNEIIIASQQLFPQHVHTSGKNYMCKAKKKKVETQATADDIEVVEDGETELSTSEGVGEKKDNTKHFKCEDVKPTPNIAQAGYEVFPFILKINCLPPPSVLLYLSRHYNGSPIGVSYDLELFQGSSLDADIIPGHTNHVKMMLYLNEKIPEHIPPVNIVTLTKSSYLLPSIGDNTQLIVKARLNKSCYKQDEIVKIHLTMFNRTTHPCHMRSDALASCQNTSPISEEEQRKMFEFASIGDEMDGEPRDMFKRNKEMRIPKSKSTDFNHSKSCSHLNSASPDSNSPPIQQTIRKYSVQLVQQVGLAMFSHGYFKNILSNKVFDLNKIENTDSIDNETSSSTSSKSSLGNKSHQKEQASHNISNRHETNNLLTSGMYTTEVNLKFNDLHRDFSWLAAKHLYRGHQSNTRNKQRSTARNEGLCQELNCKGENSCRDTECLKLSPTIIHSTRSVFIIRVQYYVQVSVYPIGLFKKPINVKLPLILRDVSSSEE